MQTDCALLCVFHNNVDALPFCSGINLKRLQCVGAYWEKKYLEGKQNDIIVMFKVTLTKLESFSHGSSTSTSY